MMEPKSENVEPVSSTAPFHYNHTDTFAAVIEQLGITLFVTTYQAGKLVVVRSRNHRLSMLLRSFEQPMGLAVDPNRLTVGTRRQIWFLRNAHDIAPRLDPPGLHDSCYLPRASHVTGDVQGHELATDAEDTLWLVNTRFSCLCGLDSDYSFVPRWRPPFVSQLAAEDRCHLNGLAMCDGRPKFVTALGATNHAGGWRDDKAHGGIVMDVDTNEIIGRGLAMPHSPRWHDGRLWLLDSGHGRLVTMNPNTGRTESVAKLPGYTRGLALVERYAFVGLSKIRETSTFGGLPISQQKDELKCGVWLVDTLTGQTVGSLEFQGDVTELFDVQVLAGFRFPAVLGMQKDTIDGVFILPENDLRQSMGEAPD